MLTHTVSSSTDQYARPDSLSPVPSTLDATKSPLALLTAICNNIGTPVASKKLKTMELPRASSKRTVPVCTGGSDDKQQDCGPYSNDKAAKKSAKFNNHYHDKSEKSHTGNPFSSALISDISNFNARMKIPVGSGGLPFPAIDPNACRNPFHYGSSSSDLHYGSNPPMDYGALNTYPSLANGLLSNTIHVCSWVDPGKGYCGKRFPTSEELFGHVRAHTNPSIPGLSPSTNDPLQNRSNATYLSRKQAFGGLITAAASRHSPYIIPAVPGVTSSVTGYLSLWPSIRPTPGFFLPSPFSYDRPTF